MPLDLSKNYLFTLEGSMGNSVILIHFSIFLNNFYFYGLLKNVFFLFYQILQIMISSTHVSFASQGLQAISHKTKGDRL
jgi:hypothetical protein